MLHIGIWPRIGVVEAVEAGPGNPAQLHHAFNRESAPGLHFFLDLLVDGGFPVNACSIFAVPRCFLASYPSKNRNFQGLLADLALPSSAMRPSAPALVSLDPETRCLGPCRTSRRQRCQHVRIHFQRPRHLAYATPSFQPLYCSGLNSLVNILLDNPMTQNSPLDGF